MTGGIGWKVKKHGLALDNVAAVEVVTANGEVVHASAAENPELFWAIRGGGGNFGIVTAFDFAAHPTTDVFYGKIAFAASEAATVIQGWADYLRTAPDELTSTADLANPFRGPEAPVEIYLAFDGDDPELAAQAIDPIRRLGTMIDDDVALQPYADTLADGTPPPPGLQFALRSAFVDKESVPEVLQILAEVRASERSPFIAVRSVGGAVSRVPRRHHRLRASPSGVDVRDDQCGSEAGHRGQIARQVHHGPFGMKVFDRTDGGITRTAWRSHRTGRHHAPAQPSRHPPTCRDIRQPVAPRGLPASCRCLQGPADAPALGGIDGHPGRHDLVDAVQHVAGSTSAATSWDSRCGPDPLTRALRASPAPSCCSLASRIPPAMSTFE